MGSAAPNSQYSYLREIPQPITAQSDAMDSHATKGKAPATSVYPSPADEVVNTFSAQSSPVFQQQRVASSMQRESVTLPPIRSLVQQMPSPSTSPQLPVASLRSSTDAFLRSPIKFTRSQDDPLFPDRPMTSEDAARPQPLFGGPVQPSRDQPAAPSGRDQQLFTPSTGQMQGRLDEPFRPQPRLGGLTQLPPIQFTAQSKGSTDLSALPGKSGQPSSNVLEGNKRTSSEKKTYPPGRKPKQRQTPYDILMRQPVLPGAPRYGRNDLWGRQIADPERFVNPVIKEWDAMFEAVKATLPEPTFPLATPPGVYESLLRISPADAAEFARRHSITVPKNRSQEKRKADSATEMPPPKRPRKTSDNSTSTKPSTSPREASVDVTSKKFRRRNNEANRAKAPSEKVARDYSIYPDYCPPLSTLDSDQVNFPNIEWKATPQDVADHEDCHLLHPKEIPIVSKLVLTPSDYIYIKRRFFANRLKYAREHHAFNINAAQLACKGADEHGITGIDVNKTSRLHKAFDKVGWLDAKHMRHFL